MDRYIRHTALEGFGEEGQVALSKASIALIGVGGVGSPCLELLAGAGVGRIVLVEGDVVSENNLHRQTIYKTKDISKPKVELAKEYALELNPNIKVESINKYLRTKEDFEEALASIDLCIDATDSFESRFAISSYLKAKNIPCIMASAEGYVAEMVLFGGDFYLEDFLAGDDFAKEKAKKAAIFSPVAHLSGVWAASEAIQILSKMTDFRAGKFQYFDMQRNKFFTANF